MSQRNALLRTVILAICISCLLPIFISSYAKTNKHKHYKKHHYRHPRYSKAPKSAINNIDRRIHQNKLIEAHALIDAQLHRHPHDVTLLLQKVDVYIREENYGAAKDTLREIEAIDPRNPRIVAIRRNIEVVLASIPRNEIGIGQDEVHVSDLDKWWSYTSVHYYRFTDWGNYGARFNFAHRYGINGRQYVLEAYPKLGRRLHLTAIFGWSNTDQRVFPKYIATFEPYLVFPNGFFCTTTEISAGLRWVKSFEKNIYNWTGSFGIYPGQYYFWFRPSHYIPSDTDYFEVGVRRFFDEKNTYIGFRASTGKYPDIGNVPPFNQIVVVNATAAAIEGSMPVNKWTIIKLGLGYARQVYETGLVRRLTNVSAEFNWQF